MDEAGSSRKPSQAEGLEAVVDSMLDVHTGMGRYREALAALERMLREGKKPGRELLIRIETAGKAEDAIVRQRAAIILRLIREQREADEIVLLGNFLHDVRVGKEQKKAVLGSMRHFDSEERAGVLAEYLLCGGDCDAELYAVGLETLTELNKKGTLISMGRISMIGNGLESADSGLRERARGLLHVAAEHSLRAVLENPDVPKAEKLKLLSSKGYFVSHMPRSVSVLVDFMLESDIATQDEGIGCAARSTFGALMEEGLRLTEHHMERIVGMMTVDPSLSRVEPEQRENALWMLEKAVSSGMPIERKLQGWIMNAATGKWGCAGGPAEEEARARKICGLKGILLIFEKWLKELKGWVEYPFEGKEPETKWYFRPEDRRDIEADVGHPDAEVREAAKRVSECIRKIELVIFEGLAKGKIRIAAHHMAIIVGMLCAETRGDAPKAGHRVQAWRMLRHLVSSGVEVPDEQQLEIVKAAVSRLPERESGEYENAKLRKLYGLQVTGMLLAGLLEKAGAGKQAKGMEWPLQTQYRREIAYDNCHPDAEVADAAARVNELILKIAGKRKAGCGSLKPAQPAEERKVPDVDEILQAYVAAFRSGDAGGRTTAERVLEEAWAEAGEELAKKGKAEMGRNVHLLGRVETTRRPLEPPNRQDRKDDYLEAEITPIALDLQALEALIDKPGITPALQRALGRIAGRVEKGPEKETAGGRLWPPPNGGKKQ